MSEAKSRFRIRKGEIEVEYEGLVKDVNERYKEALEWLKSIPKTVEEKKIRHEKEGKVEEKEKRGGARKSLYSPKIDELISEGFFKLPDKKRRGDVVKALQEKGLPVTGKEKVILNALKRRLDTTLKGTKIGDEWVFWTE